jgi:hypothetical protein
VATRCTVDDASIDDDGGGTSSPTAALATADRAAETAARSLPAERELDVGDSGGAAAAAEAAGPAAAEADGEASFPSVGLARRVNVEDTLAAVLVSSTCMARLSGAVAAAACGMLGSGGSSSTLRRAERLSKGN